MQRRHSHTIPLACAFMLMLWSCSRADHFTVEGELPGGATSNVEMTYYADGGIRRTSTVAENGKFVLKGASQQPTLALLTVSGGLPAATLITRDGEKIRLAVDSAMTGLTRLSGSGQSEKIWKFLLRFVFLSDWLYWRQRLLFLWRKSEINKPTVKRLA